MTKTVSHAIHGDRVLITVAMPSDAITAAPERSVDITLDAVDWHDVAKSVLRQQRIAEREVPPDQVCSNVESMLRREVTRALTTDHEPEVVRRRAVANMLSRIADLVLAGTVTRFDFDWTDPTVEAEIETGRGERRRMRQVTCRLVEESAKPALVGGAP
jgi:hypothetical protein